MTTLFAFLAGMSFVIAVVAVSVATAEHDRAQKAENALLASIEKLSAANAAAVDSIVAVSRHVRALADEQAIQEQMIRAVAEASVLPTIPDTGKVHILVPGSRRFQ